jgi:hypothetical protein
MAESEDDNNIYISNKEEFKEDELITYLKEKRVNKKVSFLLIYLYNSFIFFLYFLIKKANLYID